MISEPERLCHIGEIMSIDIENLSLEELLDLNKRLVRRIDYLHSLKTRAHLDRFEIGDRVSFQSEGRPIEGVVVRVNQKTLSIKTKDTYWRETRKEKVQNLWKEYPGKSIAR